jgi:hypothetical protein
VKRHHYQLLIPCVKEVRWGRYEAQDSIVLSMSNGLLFPVLSMTHTLGSPRIGLGFIPFGDQQHKTNT